MVNNLYLSIARARAILRRYWSKDNINFDSFSD